MRVAVICKKEIQKYGFGDYLYFGFKKICEADHFLVGEEVEGYDHYYYIDEGPTSYMGPKFHPASYFAFDFVIPHVWFVQSPEQYMERMRNFDRNYVFTSATKRYCYSNNLYTDFIGFAADPQFHRHIQMERPYDWIAIWHNCDRRPEMLNKVSERFPNGAVRWVGNGPDWPPEKDYSWYMNTGQCALNIPRANMVNMRVFEVMAMGVPLVTERQEDMPYFGFIENEHYLGFESTEELGDKIQWVKDNPVEAQMIAKNAYDLVLEEHTYRHRASQILQNGIMK